MKPVTDERFGKDIGPEEKKIRTPLNLYRNLREADLSLDRIDDIICAAAGYLVKAILAGDIDRMEQLGIYEVAPEDFAVAEFVDSSKLELQRIVREGLDNLRKEMA